MLRIQVPIFAIIALIATFFYALGAVYTKLIMSHIKNPLQLMMYQFTINLILVFITYLALAYIGVDFSTLFNIEYIIILSISAFFIFIGVLTYYYGLNKGNVSVATVVISSRVLFIIPLNLIFLQEFYSLATYLWIIIVLIGIFLVSWDENLSIKELLMLKGSIYYIMTNIFWAIANVLIRFLNNEVHFIGIILIRLIVLTILVFLLYSLLKKYFPFDSDSDLKKIDFKLTIITFILVLFLFIGDMGFIYSIGEKIVISEAMGSLQGLFAFFIVFLLMPFSFIRKGLKEKLDKKTITIRIIGTIIATLGTLGIICSIYRV